MLHGYAALQDVSNYGKQKIRRLISITTVSTESSTSKKISSTKYIVHTLVGTLNEVLAPFLGIGLMMGLT